MNRVVHVKNNVPGAVYIGRPSIWGNPFPITKLQDRETVIRKYKEWLWRQIQNGHITKEALVGLKDKPLACFCAPQPCHGDVLAKAIEWAVKETNNTQEV